ncbi:MAG: hypothetical protein U0R71_13930 [Solirubrobacterales bacterium]
MSDFEMTLDQYRDRLTRALAAAVGAGLVLALVVAARPAGSAGRVLPASLRFSAALDSEVAAAPAAPRAFLRSGPLRPGGRTAGTVRLRNQTGSPLTVGLRAEPSSTALDGLTRVRITAAGRVLADTTLQLLRQGTPGRVRLAPGTGVRIRVTAAMPADAGTGYEGARVAVRLVPEYADGGGR